MKLRFGEEHIKVNTLIALTGFFKRAFRFGYTNMSVIAEVIRNGDFKL